MEEIFNRRSIRKYKDKDVSDNTIKKILKAGMAAPSAGDQQPWQFIVIDEDEIKKQITNIHPYADMLNQAPAGILVCGDKSLEKHKGYWVQDCSAATQNILLMIDSLGLAGVWLGVYPREKRVNGISKLFDLPENVIPFSLISMGYPAEAKKPNDRYLENRVHYNKW